MSRLMCTMQLLWHSMVWLGTIRSLMMMTIRCAMVVLMVFPTDCMMKPLMVIVMLCQMKRLPRMTAWLTRTGMMFVKELRLRKLDREALASVWLIRGKMVCLMVYLIVSVMVTWKRPLMGCRMELSMAFAMMKGVMTVRVTVMWLQYWTL